MDWILRVSGKGCWMRSRKVMETQEVRGGDGMKSEKRWRNDGG